MQEYAIEDMFNISKMYYSDYELTFHISFFEIYGGRLLDLLNERKQLQLMEDKNQKIQVWVLKLSYKFLSYSSLEDLFHSTFAISRSTSANSIQLEPEVSVLE